MTVRKRFMSAIVWAALGGARENGRNEAPNYIQTITPNIKSKTQAKRHQKQHVFPTFKNAGTITRGEEIRISTMEMKEKGRRMLTQSHI